MKQSIRQQVHIKYGGHCAYCGKKIAYKDMQVDHIIPKIYGEVTGHNVDTIENYNPSCRRCNHYKRGESLDNFRLLLKTLHERTQKIYINKVAEDYGIIKIQPFDGLFYFERLQHATPTTCSHCGGECEIEVSKYCKDINCIGHQRGG